MTPAEVAGLRRLLVTPDSRVEADMSDAKKTITIEIKDRWTDRVIYAAEIDPDVDECWRTREAVEQAVKAGANLDGANLVGANLAGANLVGAESFLSSGTSATWATSSSTRRSTTTSEPRCSPRWRGSHDHRQHQDDPRGAGTAHQRLRWPRNEGRPRRTLGA
jgi:hypothetical protein